MSQGFLRCVLAGSRPGGRVTCLLLRQKKVTKEKATLFVVPTLRYGHAAMLDQSGVSCKLACGSDKHEPLSALPCTPRLLSKGFKGEDKYEVTCKRSALACSPIPIPNLFLQARPGSAEERRRRRIKFLDVQRRRSRLVSKLSGHSEHRKVPVAQRRDPDCGSPFLLLTLLLAKQKKSE